MRVLIIKTSSMGDVIHTLPALTDAKKVFPDIQFDWVVEENFAEIPRWHSQVDKIIPIALRRWRKNIFSATTRAEWKACYEQLQTTQYDFIIDAQGLLKSAWLVWMAKGTRCGLDWNSARETFASLFYQRKIAAGKVKELHAVTRMRNLFAGVLGYAITDNVPDYGVDRNSFLLTPSAKDYFVFLHGTTWPTKHWPEEYWCELAKLVNAKNIAIKLPWGNQVEYERAQRMAKHCDRAEVLPKMKLAEIAQVLAGAKAAVAVDTGLGHLAAALDVPTVSLYGPTNPVLTGALGRSQVHLTTQFQCSPCLSSNCTYRGTSSFKLNPPCFSKLSPQVVLGALEKLSSL
jgi:heptosyltransferase-1